MQLVGLLFALFGLWLLTGGLQSINTGDIITLLTAVAVALNILTIDKFVKEKKSVAVLCFQQFFTTSVLSFLTIALFNLPLGSITQESFVPLIYLAIFGNGVAQGLQLLCQKHLPALTSSLLLSTEPIFAALFAWTLGNETFVVLSAIGGLLIVVGLVITEIPMNTSKLKKFQTQPQ